MKTAKTAILTMGLPGSGKSTSLAKKFDVSQYTIIDPDTFKKNHPDYDPKNPSALHSYSKIEADKLLNATIAKGDNLILDGTGCNAEKLVQVTKDLQVNGYDVTLFYVIVPVKIAIERNAKRERTVPVEIILEKAQVIETSFEIVSRYADKIELYHNY